MRRFLCDYARTKKRLKRNSGRRPVPLEEVEQFLSDDEADEVLALDEALDRLAELDPRGSEVVQYRFFSGLTLEETAEAWGFPSGPCSAIGLLLVPGCVEKSLRTS